MIVGSPRLSQVFISRYSDGSDLRLITDTPNHFRNAASASDRRTETDSHHSLIKAADNLMHFTIDSTCFMHFPAERLSLLLYSR